MQESETRLIVYPLSNTAENNAKIGLMYVEVIASQRCVVFETRCSLWKAVVDVPCIDCNASAYLFLYNMLQLIATRCRH